MIKTIIVLLVLAFPCWFAFKKLFQFLKGDETGCSCSSCPSDKKSSCHSFKKH